MVDGEEYYSKGARYDAEYCEWVIEHTNDESISQEQRDYLKQEAALCQV